MESNQLSSFPKFSKLPLEIRLRIWDFIDAQRDSLVMAFVYDNWTDEHTPYEIGTRSSLPVILQVCFESRTEGLKRYSPVFLQKNGQPAVYVNFKTDTLYIEHMEWPDDRDPPVAPFWGMSSDDQELSSWFPQPLAAMFGYYSASYHDDFIEITTLMVIRRADRVGKTEVEELKEELEPNIFAEYFEVLNHLDFETGWEKKAAGMFPFIWTDRSASQG